MGQWKSNGNQHREPPYFHFRFINVPLGSTTPGFVQEDQPMDRDVTQAGSLKSPSQNQSAISLHQMPHSTVCNSTEHSPLACTNVHQKDIFKNDPETIGSHILNFKFKI